MFLMATLEHEYFSIKAWRPFCFTSFVSDHVERKIERKFFLQITKPLLGFSLTFSLYSFN